MLKRFIIALVGFIVIVALLGGVKVAQIKTASSQPHTMPPSSVTTVEAREETWAPSLSVIATLAPVQGVMLGTDADGIISKISVENGAVVKAGDVLLTFDTTVEASQLAAAESKLALARLDLKRSTELLSKNTISQAELDQATAQLNQTEADAGALRAQLEKKIVRAPFDGRVGIRLVNVGQFVSRGSPLLPLQKLNPMYVDFNIPQRQLPSLVVGQEVNVKVDAFGDRGFPGKITAINPQVDPSSRNVSAQALIENPGEVLRAGMFAHVEVLLPAAAPSIILPATAIAYASYGNSVFIIEKMKGRDGTEYLGARQQFVKLGVTRGDQIAILEGVKPGEQVATAGVFKLRNGLPVQVNNSVLPSNNPAPKPANT
ncbi:MAG: efflux RND transporter periplasmic adaptor subunit [Opitutaceae bacterium]|jgi:membrane fusion protein (multidrug efflux system)